MNFQREKWGLSKKCCNVNLFNGLAYHNVDHNVFEKNIFEKDIIYVVVVYEMCMIESIPSLALLFRTFWWEITGRCQIRFAQAWKHQINGVQKTLLRRQKGGKFQSWFSKDVLKRERKQKVTEITSYNHPHIVCVKNSSCRTRIL